jgi:hypothetical protein
MFWLKWPSSCVQVVCLRKLQFCLSAVIASGAYFMLVSHAFRHITKVQQLFLLKDKRKHVITLITLKMLFFTVLYAIRAGPEIRECGRRDPSRWPRGTLYQQTLALTSPTSGDRSVSIVRSQTQATEFSFFSFIICH